MNMMCNGCEGGVCKEGVCGHGSCGACKTGGRRCWWAKIAWVLVVVGGLNWGLIGLGAFLGKEWNLVHTLLASMPKLEWIVYLLVGIATIVKIFGGCHCKTCMSMKNGDNMMM